MRLTIFAIGLPLLLVASSVSAKTLEDVSKDLASFFSVIQQDKTHELADAEDAKNEALAELFPSLGAESVDTENQGAFVTFLEGRETVELKDVPRSAWFAPYVRDAAEQRILSGYRDSVGKPLGEFRPTQNVSLEEVTKMALLASQSDLNTCEGTPKNLTAQGSWGASYIACAESLQWVVFTDGVVDVHRPATRSEVVMTLLQAFGIPLKDPTGQELFKDVSAATLFGPAIYTAVTDGIVSGYADAAGRPTGMFGPDNSINRAEMAKMISLAVQVYRK